MTDLEAQDARISDIVVTTPKQSLTIAVTSITLISYIHWNFRATLLESKTSLGRILCNRPR